jgi:hypothetical protein
MYKRNLTSANFRKALPLGLPGTADLKVRTTPEYGRPEGLHYI